nr:uncharacterized protein LOC105845917 isoform X2 [Hydra vulgaris]
MSSKQPEHLAPPEVRGGKAVIQFYPGSGSDSAKFVLTVCDYKQSIKFIFGKPAKKSKDWIVPKKKDRRKRGMEKEIKNMQETIHCFRDYLKCIIE